ncbi:MAG: hypothetical protein RQ756_08150 [Flavobacteriaceae bacterium]|nr:hypothetical protein [Flavobacteriaceae bacterium]
MSRNCFLPLLSFVQSLPLWLLLGLLCLGCNQQKFKKQSPESLLKEKEADLSIDWAAPLPDVYPLFELQQEMLSPEEQLRSFRQRLSQLLTVRLSESPLESKEIVISEAELSLSIDTLGNITLQALEHRQTPKSLIAKVDSLLYQKINALPQVIPASKRGIPVKCATKVLVSITTSEAF